MKPLALALAVLGLALLPAVHGAARADAPPQYKQLNASDEWADIIDMGSLQTAGGYAQVTSISIYPQARKAPDGRDYVFISIRFDVDCPGKQVRARRVTYQGAALEPIFDTGPIATDWKAVPPATTGEAIYRAVCTAGTMDGVQTLPSDLRAIRAQYFPSVTA